MNFISRTIIVASLCLLSTPAFAYLDPGSGSMILNIILGLIASVGVGLKIYWGRVKAFFSRSGPDQKNQANDGPLGGWCRAARPVRNVARL